MENGGDGYHRTEDGLPILIPGLGPVPRDIWTPKHHLTRPEPPPPLPDVTPAIGWSFL